MNLTQPAPVAAPPQRDPASRRPVLVVSIDTEEEFDWHAPFSSANRSVAHASELPRLQEVFDDCGVRPTYMVDHPIATSEASVRVLGDIHRRGACEVGAHLRPWVNPPLREEISGRNSYLCNLPLDLQQEKLAELTGAIRTAFGTAPTSFKAGRYGLDFALTPALCDLGYRVDASVRALENLRGDGGPDWSEHAPIPFWIEHDQQRLLEVPCSVGFNRRPFATWAKLHRWLSRWGRPMRAVGLLWHTRLLRRIALTPEEHGTDDLIRLAQTMAHDPAPVLHLTLHSPSVGVGFTPYVRTEDERDRFLGTLRRALNFIVCELGAASLMLSECPQEFSGRPFSIRPV